MQEVSLISEINWAIITPILIIQAILLVIALVDLYKVERTNGPKWLWVLIIIFINIVGPIVYFTFGRRQD